MSNINVSHKNIIDDHFDNLPEWVNKELFYKEISEQIDDAVTDACTCKDTTVNLVWILATPLESEWIDTGSSGGIDQHCPNLTDFVYAISKDGFIEDCFVCGMPIKGEAVYQHNEALCSRCAEGFLD